MIEFILAVLIFALKVLFVGVCTSFFVFFTLSAGRGVIADIFNDWHTVKKSVDSIKKENIN